MFSNEPSPSLLQEIAQLAEGRVEYDDRFAVLIKGSVLGFPLTLQALRPHWPFGLTYTLETNVIEDPNNQRPENPLVLTVSPRITRGIASFFARALLFEPRGQKVEDKRMGEAFMFNYNDEPEANRFLTYPGVYDKLVKLDRFAKFSELMVRMSAGISLSQPTAFNGLRADVFKETTYVLGELGQIIFESF